MRRKVTALTSKPPTDLIDLAGTPRKDQPMSNELVELNRLVEQWDATSELTTDDLYLFTEAVIGTARAVLSAIQQDTVAGEVELPCDVKLPPATTINAGCKLSTLIHALELRGMNSAALWSGARP